ncbi:MAG TPA: Nif3-like dinuclear metal center hexameric protein [Cyclobacteriaceae bacterium]
METVNNITKQLENKFPLSYQEDYDNSGLIVGNSKDQVYGILISLDITEKVIEEAIDKSCNLIISHHPIIFRGLKRLTGSNLVERCVMKSIKESINLYAIHTNLDNVLSGVNHKIAEKLSLNKLEILSPKASIQSKLVVFVPPENTGDLMEGLNKAGAGIIGNYEYCTYQINGRGTFRPNEDANPYIGSAGALEYVDEIRLEAIFPKHLEKKVVEEMKNAHPYEEVAYFISPLDNKNNTVGSGVLGQLSDAMETTEFLRFLKEKMLLNIIKHTEIIHRKISKVSICGGSGSFLLPDAIARGADIFISSDFKYHDFFQADGRIIIADIGHYESEQFTKEILYDILQEKFTNIAIHLSEINTNPIKYF